MQWKDLHLKPTEITFCVSTEWTEVEVVTVQHVCLYIYFGFYTNTVIDAEIPPAVQNVWELLYAEAIRFWYITPCVCVYFPELQRVTAAHPKKHDILQQASIMGFPLLMLWFELESCKTSQPGVPLCHWKTRTVTISLSKESNLWSVFLICACPISQKHTFPFYSSKKTHKEAKH